MAAVTSWEHSYYWDRYFHSNSIVEGVGLQKTTFISWCNARAYCYMQRNRSIDNSERNCRLLKNLHPLPSPLLAEGINFPLVPSSIALPLLGRFYWLLGVIQVDTREQLRNVSKMKLYRYRYSREYLEHAGLTTEEFELEDTGVLAQEMKEVLPEAVSESVSDIHDWLPAKRAIKAKYFCCHGNR